MLLKFVSNSKGMLSLFFSNESVDVPEQLMVRQTGDLWIALLLVVVVCSIMAAAKFSNSKSFYAVGLLFIRFVGTENILKENMRLNSFSSIMLVLNYYMAFGLCAFLCLKSLTEMSASNSLLVTLFVLLGQFILDFVLLNLIGWMSGERSRIYPAIVNTFSTAQFFSFILLFLALIWIAERELGHVLAFSLASVFCLKYVIRLFKSSIAVLGNGVKWYYIILYICTLEILPLFVVYLYISEHFRLNLS